MPSQRLSQTMQKLDFPEKLIQSGKKENSDALLKRMKTLHQKLASLEQDFVDVKSLEPIRKPLINNIILHHKDRGVKAYAACCLADLLRLYAPDAPYTAEELRDIFQFFSAQIHLNLRPPPIRPLQPSRGKVNDASQTQSQTQSQGAASQRITDVAYYTEYCYLLESLATIKSVVLACDVPGGDDLVTGFFDGFVDVVRPDMSKTLIRHLVNILAAVVEESATIPQGVMDCIINQFENYAAAPETPSFQMIVDVCNLTADRLQRPVLAHISEVQISHGRDPSPEDLKELVKSHRLLISIYRHAPGLLLNVIPVLEENLKAADEVPLRQLSTKTLGKMFGERPVVGGGTADLARAYPSTWRAWLGRRLDKSSVVRLAWVEASRGILIGHPELRKDLEGLLVDRVQDAKDEVRAAICKVFGSLGYETTLHHISEKSLKAIGARMSDKKSSVRAEAAKAMAQLWTAAYSEIEANDAEAVTHFGWIPQAMLECLCKEIPSDTRTQMTSIIKNSVLPLPSKTDDEQAWVDRLMLVASHLNDNAFNALERITGLPGYKRGSSPFGAFLSLCEANNGGVIDENAEAIKARLAFVTDAISKSLFAEPEKAKKDIEAFAAANEARLYKLFKHIVDLRTDLKTLVKSKNEFLRRIEQSHTDILETFTVIVDHACFNIVNTSSISPLIKTLQHPGSGATRTARVNAAARLLRLMAKECAPMFSSHLAELSVVLADKKNDLLVEVALRALAALAAADPDACPKDTRTIEKIIKRALEGTPKQAKFAARFLAKLNCEDDLNEVITSIIDDLGKKENRLLAHLRVLTELSISASPLLEDRTQEIHTFIMGEVIYKQSPSASEEPSDEWIEETELPILDQAKLLALRLITHRVLGFVKAENIMTIAEPVINLMRNIIKNDGTTDTAREAEGGHTRVHLRLRAALCSMKLAHVRVLDKAMKRNYTRIAFLMQDPCYHVRHRLLGKVGQIVSGQRLLPRWNVLPSLIATDPNKENAHMARQIHLKALRECRNMDMKELIDRVEMPLARLLFLLSHHPDVKDMSLAELKILATYVDFYLDCVAKRDNITLLFAIAVKLKAVKGVPDAEDFDDDENMTQEEAAKAADERLYKLAELAQVLIRKRAEAQKWTITTFPGTFRLPSDIFHNLTSNTEVAANTRRAYLTDEEVTWAKTFGRKGNAIAGPSRRAGDGLASSPVKRTKSTKSGSRKRSKRSVESDSEDEEDDESVDGVESEVDDEDEDMEDEEGADVLGRGGRRGAKTKAKKGLRPKSSKKRSPKKVESPRKGEESELSELSEMED